MAAEDLRAAGGPAGDEVSPAYAAQVGERLRAVRRQQRLSLQAVEARTAREFRASALGAYERGERVISVPRLQRLAAFYRVPVDQLLPPAPGSPAPRLPEDADGLSRPGKVRIDLVALEGIQGPERALVGRFVELIQLQRQDFNGRLITVRDDDLRALACLLDTAPEHTRTRLEELGLRA